MVAPQGCQLLAPVHSTRVRRTRRRHQPVAPCSVSGTKNDVLVDASTVSAVSPGCNAVGTINLFAAGGWSEPQAPVIAVARSQPTVLDTHFSFSPEFGSRSPGPTLAAPVPLSPALSAPTPTPSRRGSSATASELDASLGGETAVSSPELLATLSWTGLGTVSTVMLRNIPLRCSTEDLLEQLTCHGFGASFDFLYLPMDFDTKKNRGFAFINFTKPCVATNFAETFTGRQFTRYRGRKVLEVSPACTQGFDATVAQYLRRRNKNAGKESSVMNPWFKPMIFVPGDAQDPRRKCLQLTEENVLRYVNQTETYASSVEDQECAALLIAVQNFIRSCESGADACNPLDFE